ncbi:hypothetical protein ACSVDA_10680 [Cytobacillus sp. Hm23]
MFNTVYFTKPTDFPTNEQLIVEMNNLFPEGKVSKIQDKLYLNEKNVFVPFISENDIYGTSYWVWKKCQWSMVSIDTEGGPIMWQANKKDPHSYYIVWNIDPGEQVAYIDFYLTKKRSYSVTEAVHHYYRPSILLKQNVSILEEPYGAMSIPIEWSTFIEGEKEIESAKNSNTLLGQFYYFNRYMLIGYILYDVNHKETALQKSINRHRFSTENIDFEYLFRLNENEIKEFN